MNNSISPRSLQEGEFVVHKKYGIGRFCGIKKVQAPPAPLLVRKPAAEASEQRDEVNRR